MPPVHRKENTMAIDDSVLTYSVFAICAALLCVRTFRKTKNILRTVVMFFWVMAIYLVVSCSIFPIQLNNFGVYLNSFTEMFYIMDFDLLIKYFPGYFMANIEYFSSFLVFAFVGYILFPQMRKTGFGAIVLLGLLIVHVVYNVCLNVVLDTLVKFINAEDLYMITLGFITGWLCGKLTLKIWPTLSAQISKKCGE